MRDRQVCIDCGKKSPETETNYTLISAQFGWRLSRRRAANGDFIVEWRCAECWRDHKKKIEEEPPSKTKEKVLSEKPSAIGPSRTLFRARLAHRAPLRRRVHRVALRRSQFRVARRRRAGLRPRRLLRQACLARDAPDLTASRPSRRSELTLRAKARAFASAPALTC
jgi:hypothetical protein